MAISIYPYGVQKVERLDLLPVNDGDVDLDLLGVPSDLQGQPPTLEAYPERFSDDGYDVWIRLLKSDHYATAISGHTLGGTWYVTLTLFLELCEELGVAPLSDDGTAANTAFLYGARAGRRSIVQFVDQTGLLRQLDIFRAWREYVRTSDGIIIHCWAQMVPYHDQNRNQFQDQLLTPPQDGGPRFTRLVNNHLVRVVRPNAQVYVKCFNMNRIVVGFTIEILGHVTVPGIMTPTRQQVDHYIDESIWFPIVRQRRFRGVVRRVF